MYIQYKHDSAAKEYIDFTYYRFYKLCLLLKSSIPFSYHYIAFPSGTNALNSMLRQASSISGTTIFQSCWKIFEHIVSK